MQRFKILKTFDGWPVNPDYDPWLLIKVLLVDPVEVERSFGHAAGAVATAVAERAEVRSIRWLNDEGLNYVAEVILTDDGKSKEEWFTVGFKDGAAATMFRLAFGEFEIVHTENAIELGGSRFLLDWTEED